MHIVQCTLKRSEIKNSKWKYVSTTFTFMATFIHFVKNSFDKIRFQHERNANFSKRKVNVNFTYLFSEKKKRAKIAGIGI